MLLGEEYAKTKGYSLHGTSEDKQHATYVKYFNKADNIIAIFATFDSVGNVTLERAIGLIMCEDKISYPHKLFDRLESELVKIDVTILSGKLLEDIECRKNTLGISCLFYQYYYF